MQTRREIPICEYRYDALDRLIAHSPPRAPEHQLFYCKSRLATEIQGAMHSSIVQDGDQLLAQQQSEGDVFDTTLLATDQQRSVLHTLKATHSQQPIAYTPYGHRSAESGLLSLLGFNGERPDPVTGHYLLGKGYRAFNPVLMRFNSPDSWSPFGKGGLNPYAYCLGDPANLTDPNGHSPFVKVMSSTIVFRKISPHSKTIAFTESSTTTISTRISKKHVDSRGNFIETTKIFNEQGVQKTKIRQIGDEITLVRPDQPVFTYPATPSLTDLAYSAVRPADLTPLTRAVVKTMSPQSTDLRNKNNHLSEVEFNLRKFGIPDAEIAQRSRPVRDYNLIVGNIRGAFPEKLNWTIEPVIE